MRLNFSYKGIRIRPVWQPLIMIGGVWFLIVSAHSPVHPAEKPDTAARTDQRIISVGAADLSGTPSPPDQTGSLDRLMKRYGWDGAPFSSGKTKLLWSMGLIAAATLISEDMTCIGAGLMVARDAIAFIPATAACFIGIFIGDLLLFAAGRIIGKPALRLPPFKWLIKPEDIDGAARWFAARGPVIIITSRFLPGSRLPTYFTAGMLGTRLRVFAGYFSLAALLWTPLLVGIAAAVGGQMMIYFQMFQQYALLILLGTFLLLWSAVKLLLPLFSYRGRRLLLSSWRRKTRWEFWSPYLFYVPVVLYVALLAIRHRSLTVFTAANPGIPESGFLFESKSDILDNFRDERDFIASYRLIRQSMPMEARLKAARDFMHTHCNGYPVVLKPDFGQRGSGVAVIRNEPALTTYLTLSRRDVIIQEFAAGREFGLFYVRYPDQESGRLFSITDKRQLSVMGDGQRTLAELILADDQAVNMAPLHFRQHRRHLYDIPADGQEVMLVEIGTHCRGAVFKDGWQVKTPELEAAVDRLAKGFEGFYFGRFDIRTPCVEDLKQGRNFKVVELNGVTSEATHIYQRGTSLRRAYAVLMRQWRIAYEIGALNARNGCPKASILKLVRMLLRSSSPAAELPHR